MLSAQLIFSLWFLLNIISEIYSKEYLHFGGTEEENRQAEYYLSADSGANIDPTEEVIRTQRSFWKLFNKGLFGNCCGNCCSNCNYNVGTGNSMPSLLLPFQPLKPLRPLPLWRPLEPLFGRSKCNNYGAEKYTENSKPSMYDVNTYAARTSNNVVPVIDPVESVPLNDAFQLDKAPVVHNTYDQSNSSGMSAYRNDERIKEPQNADKNGPRIIYQPIIYVSSQYQGNKAVHRHTQESFESENNEGMKSYSHTILPNKVPALSLSYTSENPSVPAVSTVYNIITHPYKDSAFNPSATGDPFMFASDHLPSDNYSLDTPATINYLPFPPPSTHTFVPMILTSDDQPYRVCPELFQEYQRKLSLLLPHT